jgi:PAS domain S-box-containing protein
VAGRLRSPVAAPAAPDALVGITEGEVLPILLVDDRVENLRALESVLEGLAVPLESVTSGEEALRRLLVRDYALILLDVRMPGLDGLQTAELIKGRDRSREVPIVFLTAARDEVDEILRGYGVGAIDYVLKPFDPELLRSKVSVFVELERNRRMLKRSEAFLRGAFEAAPIGKTVLDGARRIVRANPAFGRLLGREPASLIGVAVDSLCQEEDRALLLDALAGIADGASGAPEAEQASADVRLLTSSGTELWVGAVASSIDPAELADPLLLVQWIDLSSRRRAEQARAELLLEHSARTNAEAIAERLDKLQTLSAGIDSLALGEVLPELAVRLAELFEAELAEVEVAVLEADPIIVRAAGGRVLDGVDAPQAPADARTEEVPIVIEHAHGGRLRLVFRADRSFTAADRSLLGDAAERAALAIRRARLHEREHNIAAELQRGLVPKRLPRLEGLRIAAFYQAAGDGVEVGGDWYDAFELDADRLGVVLGDVAGRGIPAASAMGQLRSVTRAFALADDCRRAPGEVLTLLNRHQLALGAEELFTVLYAIVDRPQRTITWSNAGHLPPLLRTGSGEASLLEGGNGLMGIQDVRYESFERSLSGSGTLVLYTDGLVERRGESIDAGFTRLTDAAIAGPEDPQALCEHLLARVLPADGALHDDVTAVVVRVS